MPLVSGSRHYLLWHDARHKRLLCSGCGRSPSQPELTVSATLPTSKGAQKRSRNDGFQGTADVADR